MKALDNQEMIQRPVVQELLASSITEIDQELPSNSFDPFVPVLDADDLGTVLSVGEFSGAAGATVTVPITISDAEGLQSLNVTLTYDTSILNIVDPDTETTENEGVKRAGISEGWELEPNNPVANVNEETGEVSISLINTQEIPEADEDGNVPSGTILAIDFQVSADAELNEVANIDLQSARVGINGEEIVVGEDNLDDGNLTVSNTIDLFRFRNTTFETGTYIFVGEAEREFILNDPDLSNIFELDGVTEDGTINPAFTASTVDGDDLIPFFRLESLTIAGTFLFVSTAEYNFIFNDPNQSEQWKKQGFDPLDQTIDIPEFYLLDGSADTGIEFTRFQNLQNNTFLYAGPGETEFITSDPNLNNLFLDQNTAFKSLPS